MGSHESYSFEKTKQVIRNQHPHQETKRVHFEKEKHDMETEETEVPLFKEDSKDKKGGNENNNAIINTESNITCDVNQSIANANCVPTIHSNNDTDSNYSIETMNASDEDANNTFAVKENNVKNEILKSQLSVEDVREDSAKQHKVKTKMTLDELMASLTQISFTKINTRDDHRSSHKNDIIPNNQQRLTPTAREINLPGKEFINQKNRPNGKRESRYSWGQYELETLYEEVGQADEGKKVQLGRRMSGDYDNLTAENTSENATDGQDNDSDVISEYKEDPLVQKELKLRHGKLWLYKYNYLNFNRKAQIQNQQGIGYYKSSCSLDGYMCPPKLPTIYNNRGYISQSFESYLNKSGMPPRVNHMSHSSTTNQQNTSSPTSPTVYNVSYFTNTSDEGYYSHLDSASPHSGDAGTETFQTGTFDFTDNRLPTSDTGVCLFTTFKPEENSVSQHPSNNSSEISVEDKSRSHLNQNGSSVGYPGRGTFTQQTEPENQQTFDAVEPLHGTDGDDESKPKSKEVFGPSTKENDLSNGRNDVKAKDKTPKKKTSWKVNFKLCCGSGFKKKFLLFCLQVIFTFFKLKRDI